MASTIDYSRIESDCLKNSAIVKRVLDDFLLYYVAAREKLDKKSGPPAQIPFVYCPKSAEVVDGLRKIAIHRARTVPRGRPPREVFAA